MANIYCRQRHEINYIAQGAWSASVGEGVEGAFAADFAWKWRRWDHQFPSVGTLLSTAEGYAAYEVAHPGKMIESYLGYRNYEPGIGAFIIKYHDIFGK